MADMDKLKELFDELLSDYESRERDLMNEFSGDEEKLKEEVADYRQRFDEAMQAPQAS
jgi:hypothetical protein